MGDASVRPDDKEIPRVIVPANRPVQLADHLPGIAREKKREAGLRRPIRQRRVRVGADADDDDLASVVEDRGVLITVRLQLDRSTTCSRDHEESEHDCLSSVVRQLSSVLQKSEPGRAANGEVRCGVAHRWHRELWRRSRSCARRLLSLGRCDCSGHKTKRHDGRSRSCSHEVTSLVPAKIQSTPQKWTDAALNSRINLLVRGPCRALIGSGRMAAANREEMP